MCVILGEVQKYPSLQRGIFVHRPRTQEDVAFGFVLC